MGASFPSPPPALSATICCHHLPAKSNKSGGSRYFPAFPFLFMRFPKTVSRVKEAIILVLCASHNVYHSADGNHVSKSISQGILLSCLNLPFSILPERSSPIMSRLPHSIESTPSHYNLLPHALMQLPLLPLLHCIFPHLCIVKDRYCNPRAMACFLNPTPLLPW